MQAPKRVLALVGDLLFAVRIADVVRGMGHEPRLVETPAQLERELGSTPDLVLLDLALVDRWAASVRVARDTPHLAAIPMLAFGAHMNVTAQQRARSAGVDRVVANSKFAADLPSLIEQLLA